ncbi:MAG: hypothetical protein R3C02_00810 [Planctomycetaceae bacterium]
MAGDGTQSEHDSTVKWRKPKILLIDLPVNIESALKAEGYNVAAGTFGKPYKGEMDGTFTPLPVTGSLPNYTEQEIVFIDLTPPAATDSPEGELQVSPDQLTWWVQQSKATIDPRPRLMVMAQDAFQRTLLHGGILIVFGLPRHANKFVWARKGTYQSFEVEHELNFDNWSFCSLFRKDLMTIDSDSGNELVANESNGPLSAFFRRHAEQMWYSATFNATYQLTADYDGFTFYPLIKTKFGAAAGGVIVDRNQKGMVVVLPQCSEHQKEYVILDLLQNVLIEVARHLFPHFEGGRWVQEPEYEHASVIQLKAEQERIQLEAEVAVRELDERIANERDALGYQHGLLTKKGTELVHDVKTALEELGFSQVIDVDEQQGENAAKQEDLQILDESPVLLVEVKGLSGFPREDDTLQVVKYIPRRMKEWGRTDVSGVVIVNHQCNLPALKRDHEKVFTPQQIQDAIHQDVTLVTTWELFKLLRGLQKWGWPHEAVTPLFYGQGRIDVVPRNYHRIGVVAHFFDKLSVVSIELDASKILRVGDTLGFILREQYHQETVASIHVDREAVESATGGQRAGHKTVLSRNVLPEGLVVYRVLKDVQA